ncbi:MAG: endopeptidase La [Acidobacteriota bacterium]|jgi:ATP-dependent Lon protease
MTEHANIRNLPVLPVKNTVLFPYISLPLVAGRAASLAAIDAATGAEEKELLIIAQRDATVEHPDRTDLFDVGTRGVVRKLTKRADGTVHLLIQGLERVRLESLEQHDSYLRATVSSAPVQLNVNTETEALQQEVLRLTQKIVSLAQEVELDISQLSRLREDPLRLLYVLASMMSTEFQNDQRILEADTLLEALKRLHRNVQHQSQVLEVRRDIASKAQSQMDKAQREFLLRQQLRAIQEELGEGDGGVEGDVAELRERFEKAKLPDEVRKEAERELSRLGRLSPASPEFSVTRTYLEVVLELPWEKRSEDVLDLGRARRILDEDHHDLEEVKERILEHLAVLHLNPGARTPILCFVGPPGVGKTSLGQSIARALGRRFERMSLGGLHDEAELRGHRRTYVGAMPGRIVQAMRRAGVKNPLLMLDEIDKLGRDFRGDPASAMLEILDPEQNHTFRDNYLDLPFDLSSVFFIATANTLDTIPQPLLDRMELIRLAGYTEEDKVSIATRYLVPRQLRDTGLREGQLRFTEETLHEVIRRYTREAGLRQLERTIGRLARKVAVRFAQGETEPASPAPEDLVELLGPEPFHIEEARRELHPGVAAGLAWTQAGGEVLYVETTSLPGGSGLTLTGQLGNVMQESARAAQSYLWSHASELGIDPSRFHDDGVHIHVPSGATPKDGPSAGITIAAALASLYTGKPARADTAMTGEITIAGLVLPVGGVKEKVLAANRANLRRIILPRQNESALRDIPECVRKEIEFVFVESIRDVLAAAIPALREPAHA